MCMAEESDEIARWMHVGAMYDNNAGENSLPTPMDEPKKVIRCHFIGVTQVGRATGILQDGNDVKNTHVQALTFSMKPLTDSSLKNDQSTGYCAMSVLRPLPLSFWSASNT